MSHSHRSTLKQTNKAFKSKHASKSSLKSKGKAKVGKSTTGPLSTISRLDKRNQNKQKQDDRKREVCAAQAKYAGGMPRQVCIVSLCPDGTSVSALETIFTSQDQKLDLNHGSALLVSTLGTAVQNAKQAVSFIPCGRDLMQVLDGVRVADMVLFVLSALEPVDIFGEALMTAIKAQGVPNVHLDQVPKKKHGEVCKSLLYYMNHHFADEIKIYSLDSKLECTNCVRQITSQFPKGVSWREKVPYLISTSWNYAQGENDESGSLFVTGYVRGAKFSANRLVHIPEFGDFQLQRILAAPIAREGEVLMKEPDILHESDATKMESLEDQNIPDPMDAEQTWPTDQEIEDAQALVDSNQAGTITKKRVPKGTSSYQAAWILEDDAEGDEVLDSDDDDHMRAPKDESEESEVEYEDIEMDNRSVKFDGLDEEENAEQLKEYLEKQKEAKDEQLFPDETDTPQFLAASQRFARYRGLKSSRSTPWDPYENLPIEYARIFQFQNFKRSKKRAMDMMEEEGILIGTRITLEIKNVPSKMKDLNHDALLTISGLRPHEHKISIMNFTVTREKSYNAPVKSKDPVILVAGFRRYIVQPVYSSFTRGGPNNVHKFERFLQPGSISMATVYAPIQFGPAPVLLFPYIANTSWIESKLTPLLATGTLLDPQPLRIITKRCILTGHPFKIHKRGAVVRFMFYTPQDVDYFKPVQLHTKYGRTGHIKESLGTHGYMKCQFDKGIKQHDTICMNLYKRVFPKWNTRMYTIEEEVEEDVAMND